MELSQEDIQSQIQALKQEINELRSLHLVQQESIASLIALSQQQTAVIEQQTSVIQKLTGH
ncbi:MAG: hypothetical protein AAF289_18045 [Cyanobacteria bacterium P01_A01_bin.135]